jgi:hypothetical protein
MTWFTWLMLALLISVVAAMTGLQPKGTREVSRTRLMGIARLVLVLLVLLLLYLWYGARSS